MRYRPDGSVEHKVDAKLVLADGTEQTGRFPYPFVYPGHDQDAFLLPFRVDRGIPIQTPPPGTDMSAAPPIVNFILQHSDAAGHTEVPPCPDASPAP